MCIRDRYERKSSIGQYRYSQKWPYMPFGQQESKEIIEQVNTAGRTQTQQGRTRGSMNSPELNRSNNGKTGLMPHFYTIQQETESRIKNEKEK